MSSLGNDILGAKVVDLFAGSGALGLEALSRGAKSVVFVEASSASLRTLNANIELVGPGSEVEIFHKIPTAVFFSDDNQS